MFINPPNNIKSPWYCKSIYFYMTEGLAELSSY